MKPVKIYAIIGCNFGDEGKGMLTQYRVRESDNPIVVRFNGGAQAGHTVVKDGQRRIFSHIGSGSWDGAPTFLSKHFVVNPMLFLKEVGVGGRNSDLNPIVYIDGECPVTTPYDMMVNQIIESRRGPARHGSCGVGFGVSLDRHERGIRLQYRDIVNGDISEKVECIRDWCLEQVGEQQTDYEDPFYNLFETTSVSEFFSYDCDLLSQYAKMGRVQELAAFDTLVFEGAQGLELDPDYGVFPHVTRSSTGFKNIGLILNELNQSDIDLTVDYISRCYRTRHGAGPLSHEQPVLLGISIDDPTNVSNDWQGSLRVAPLDFGSLKRTINTDRRLIPIQCKVNKVVTCFDQLKASRIQYIWNDKVLTASRDYFTDLLLRSFDMIFESAEGDLHE